MNCGLLRSRNAAVSGVLRYFAATVAVSSRKCKATSASKKSGLARMESKVGPKLFSGHRALAKGGEHPEVDRGEQHLGWPEGHADFHHTRGAQVGHRQHPRSVGAAPSRSAG